MVAVEPGDEIFQDEIAACMRWTRSVVLVNRTRYPFSTRASDVALSGTGRPEDQQIGALGEPGIAGGEGVDLGL